MKKALKCILGIVVVLGLSVSLIHTHSHDDTNHHSCTTCEHQNTIASGNSASTSFKVNATESPFDSKKPTLTTYFYSKSTASRAPPKTS
ncbi:hypothetical protein HOH87_00780 [bacterium]|nr:hypothetical protein [bacterium]